ncbi:hypothetical protein RHGRI_016642 [Rhododendron griersonianum]|uniref:Uncharacterized protein n=1 Tax=Rhododendron griersonianum TaxID=479676 RepID=A0AAV6JV12_9ERIC|nr:hypothetical protein RHGRI_016642 [Rhododendron griersonianum]
MGGEQPNTLTPQRTPPSLLLRSAAIAMYLCLLSRGSLPPQDAIIAYIQSFEKQLDERDTKKALLRMGLARFSDTKKTLQRIS